MRGALATKARWFESRRLRRGEGGQLQRCLPDPPRLGQRGAALQEKEGGTTGRGSERHRRCTGTSSAPAAKNAAGGGDDGQCTGPGTTRVPGQVAAPAQIRWTPPSPCRHFGERLAPWAFPHPPARKQPGAEGIPASGIRGMATSDHGLIDGQGVSRAETATDPDRGTVEPCRVSHGLRLPRITG